MNFTEEVLSLNVECLVDIGDGFAFVQLDSEELIPLKKTAGIFLNDGRFILKKGLVYKVEKFLKILRTLNQEYLTSLDHHSSNNSSDLIVPEYLLKKFPFIQTLIVYSKLIADCKYDLTFLNIILNNIIRNLITEETGFRYETIVRQFATSLYILGGRIAYEFVRLNIPALLPSVQIIQAYIVLLNNHLTEGLFNDGGILKYFNMNQSTLGFVAEDATPVVPKVTYGTKSNTFIRFSLPLDSNGLPIKNSYSTDSFTRLEEWYSDIKQATLLNAYLIQPLSSSLNISPYIFAAYGTDNKFESSDVISRWYKIYQECKAKGICILGFSTDCDSRYFHSMRSSLGFFANFTYDGHPDLLSVDLPSSWCWFLMQQKQLYMCFQDAIHICTKLRNRLLSETTHLLLGEQLINMEPLLYTINNYSKLDHSLVVSDLNPKDRQNYNSAAKISSDNILTLLENIPNSLGINIYLQQGFIINYKKEVENSRRLPNTALNIWLQNSQSCEGTFISARAISSVFSAGVNFTVSQFLNRINKLSTLQSIKSNTNQNNLRFPQRHKLHNTSINISNSSNVTTLSKIAIENSVLQAYKYVAKVFSSLKIKEILRRGRIINVLIDSNGNLENDSDSEQNDEIAIGSAECSDSDEEFELNDNLYVINNSSISANRGIRLCDDVKEELWHAYFKVKINNENKFMHKQAACWALEKDKSLLSANRLLRVQGR
ncbi:unnamed protein product [Rotaria magnacalcarata]|uniref:Uncharacterized protein n=2 Tax=Rotaria magnacalcarata TaxID=392030 RepID=A0A8S2NSR3_9BILA|nr:unnamed protein product [Rotaria magnacalcarata]